MQTSDYTILDRPRVDIVEGEKFIDFELYRTPTTRSYQKIEWNNLTIQRVRSLTDYDGEIRAKATIYWTYPKSGHASGSMPHRDVESCLATHVIPLEETWSSEWGGQLRFYEDAVIPEDYKNIMKKLVSRHPPPLAMTLLNQYKSTGWTPPHNFELEMDAQESVIFKNSETAWHGVADLNTVQPRRVLIITYHNDNEPFQYGD